VFQDQHKSWEVIRGYFRKNRWERQGYVCADYLTIGENFILIVNIWLERFKRWRLPAEAILLGIIFDQSVSEFHSQSTAPFFLNVIWLSYLALYLLQGTNFGVHNSASLPLLPCLPSKRTRVLIYGSIFQVFRSLRFLEEFSPLLLHFTVLNYVKPGIGF
jgi:hypothetical protein